MLGKSFICLPKDYTISFAKSHCYDKSIEDDLKTRKVYKLTDPTEDGNWNYKSIYEE